jgi:hypothetical protein
MLITLYVTKPPRKNHGPVGVLQSAPHNVTECNWVTICDWDKVETRGCRKAKPVALSANQTAVHLRLATSAI